VNHILDQGRIQDVGKKGKNAGKDAGKGSEAAMISQ
jgi:hypothetical protein